MMRTFCGLVLLLLSTLPLAATESNRILLRVNDRIVTLYDYQVRRDERLRAIQSQDFDPARRADLIARVGVDVLTNMLDEMLVLSRADQIGYVPSEEEIDAAIARAKEGFGIQTDEQFEQALSSSGMTVDDFERQVETNLRVGQVMGREVQQRVNLEEDDLRRFYYEHPELFTTPERVRLQEIVVLDTSPLTPERRAALAEELRESMASGATMEDLASRYSAEGTTSGRVELGWIEKGDLDGALEEAVWDVPVGEVSPPAAGRGGLHLLEMLEREEATLLPFSEVAEQIDRRERERLLMEAYDKYLVELREAAYIRVSELPEDAQGFSVEDSASRMTLETPDTADSESPGER